MKNNTIFLIIAGIIILGGGIYIDTHVETNMKASAPVEADHVQTAPGDHPEVDHAANDGVLPDQKSSVSWSFKDEGEKKGIPNMTVTVVINGKSYVAGTFQGSCVQMGPMGGVDGKGLLTGELAAAQCWYAGGGDEIGVFANENGGFDIMTGELGEGVDGGAFFRGNFKIKQTIKA
ncbi:MAG: hypothetical protein JWP09_345 [Candidatus Taylorbacteria bacterium]|nr:hypothetical protein [Candidatus Taylorbacteria bacterium]